MADIVLPATMFMEHDDIYHGGGHQHISARPQADRAARRMPLQSSRSSAASRSASAPPHPGFDMTPREMIDATLKKSGMGTSRSSRRHVARRAAGLPHARTILDGFAHADRKFHFKPDWPKRAVRHGRRWGRGSRCRRCRTTGPSSRRRTRRIRSGWPRAVAQLPQHLFQRDAVEPETRRQAAREDPSRRSVQLGLADGERSGWATSAARSLCLPKLSLAYSVEW